MGFIHYLMNMQFKLLGCDFFLLPLVFLLQSLSVSRIWAHKTNKTYYSLTSRTTGMGMADGGGGGHGWFMFMASGRAPSPVRDQVYGRAQLEMYWLDCMKTSDRFFFVRFFSFSLYFTSSLSQMG